MDIKKAEYFISSPSLEKCPKSDMIEYAFIGRSNVGKSSLINMLLSRKGLAKTSATPGKTLLINYFSVNDGWYVVDLPGYGYAKRSKSTQEKIERMISSYILGREQLVVLFVLIDVRHEQQKIDMEFIQWLGENEVPFNIVFTKADKLTMGKAKGNVERYKRELSKTWEELPEIFLTSSESRTGREELLGYIDRLNGIIKSEATDKTIAADGPMNNEKPQD